MRRRSPISTLAPAFLIAVTAFAPSIAGETCPPEPPLENWTGAGAVACPCFAQNEEAGVVLDLPADEFPIEILSIRVGWGSQFGGAPASLEQSIRIYPAGLPNPGAPIFSLDGPQLGDGVINEFDIDILPGEVVVDQGPFAVTLSFLNSNAGDPFAPTVIHDGNGCQQGKNMIFAIPGGWLDACDAGVTGDWVFSVTYRPIPCGPVTTAGIVPDGADQPGTQLTVEPFANSLLLSWGASCTPTDNDYEVYEGTLGQFDSHVSRLCSTAGATSAILVPAPDSSYYLIVPRNDDNEGSYGFASDGAPRPTGSPQCLPQQAGGCP